MGSWASQPSLSDKSVKITISAEPGGQLLTLPQWLASGLHTSMHTVAWHPAHAHTHAPEYTGTPEGGYSDTKIGRWLKDIS